MIHSEDFGCGDTHSATCIHCTNTDGSVKSCEEIFTGGVGFFMQSIGSDKIEAEKIVRYNMKHNCPHWQWKIDAILYGEEATPEEFASCMQKMI
jgi:hypothetical protein